MASWVLRSVALGSALVGLAGPCGSAEEMSPDGGAGRAGLQPVVSATVPVGERGDGIAAVAVGEGGVWVAGGGECPGSVWRIDPQRNAVTATIPVDNPHDLAVGEGAVWALGSVCAPTPARPEGVSSGAALFRIDPEGNAVVDRIPLDPPAGTGLRDSSGSGVAIEAGAVWVAICLNPRTGEVVRIEARTNEVVARISTEGCAGEVAAGPDAVWVLSHPEWTDETKVLSASLHRIDPDDNELVATPLRSELAALGGTLQPPQLTAGDDAAWISGTEETYPHRNVALRVDARTHELTRKPLSGRFAPFAATDQGVWFLGGMGQQAALSRLDGRTLEVAESLPLSGGWPDAAFDRRSRSFWIADYEPIRGGDQVVVRVDLP